MEEGRRKEFDVIMEAKEKLEEYEFAIRKGEKALYDILRNEYGVESD